MSASSPGRDGPVESGKQRRRPVALFAPLVVTKPSDKEDCWVDDLTDDEFGNVIGPSSAELTGRRVEDLEIEWTDEGAGHAA